MILLQTDLTEVAQAVAPETSLSLFDFALKGGWVMIPIAILSVIAVYIFVERYFAINTASKTDINFMNRIKDYIHEGKIESAHTLCQSINNPLARMIEKGIARIGRPLNDVSAAIENLGKLEIYKLERGLALLATCSGAAPMIGFLGTVIGMVQSFYNIAQAGSNIDVALLSDGIYTALITTVFGLIVGIMAYIFYNILVAKVEMVVYKLEGNTTEFMDLLNEPVKL
ncbi:MAG: MotA/TolQ/ExbB proton channel family protein [Bacteroidales bacterium]|nr:MotA/TolQ/ExbB proton channel family protein [Bacteroidales bacterium]